MWRMLVAAALIAAPCSAISAAIAIHIATERLAGEVRGLDAELGGHFKLIDHTGVEQALLIHALKEADVVREVRRGSDPIDYDPVMHWWCGAGWCARTVEQCEKWRDLVRGANRPCEPARTAWCLGGELRYGAPSPPGRNIGVDLCYQTLAGCQPASGVFIQRGEAVSCIGVE